MSRWGGEENCDPGIQLDCKWISMGSFASYITVRVFVCDGNSEE